MNSGENTGTEMKSVETEHLIKLECKYCERCGGLWIRRRGETEARCTQVCCRGGAAYAVVEGKEPSCHRGVPDECCASGGVANGAIQP